MKMWVGEIELIQPVLSFQVPAGFDSARILVRLDQSPLGWITLSPKPGREVYSSGEIRDIVIGQFQAELTREAFCREFISDRKTDFSPLAISVVVCTRDREQNLDACLRQLCALDYADFEIIVVDNASETAATREVAIRHRVRYVRENRPGLDWARNRGVTEAANPVIAFIDDDARPDRYWLQAISRAFADSDVMAVTGLVAPQELATEAQIYFEDIYGGMGKGLQSCTYHRGWVTDETLLWASGFGVGANMAFRRTVFSQIGFFDPALDVGTATRGGGDVEFFHRVVACGYILRYDPSVLVWHVHRRDFDALQKQITSNGYCVIPYLLTCLRNKTVSFSAVLSFFVFQILCWWIIGRLIRPGNHRRRLVLAEAAALPLGFIAYWKARARAARLKAIEIAGMVGNGQGAAPKQVENHVVKCDSSRA